MAKRTRFIPKQTICPNIDDKVYACTCMTDDGEIIFCIPKHPHSVPKWKLSAYRHRVKKRQIRCDPEQFHAIAESLITASDKWKEILKQSEASASRS